MGNCCGGDTKSSARPTPAAKPKQAAPVKPPVKQDVHQQPVKDAVAEVPSKPPGITSPRDPLNRRPSNALEYNDAKEHAFNQFRKMLQFVRMNQDVGKARKFARWVPFQENYEQYLFTDVLRILELQEEQDCMSVDDDCSVFSQTLEDISIELENLDVTGDWLPNILTELKKEASQRKLPDEEEFIALMMTVYESFATKESVVHIEVPEDGRLVVVGDLHGQLDDLIWIMAEGQPSEKTHYLFNGDFVDRGPEQCEVLIYLYALKALYPNYIWLNRGNHEEHRVNKAAGKDGFMQVCINQYSDRAYKAAQKSFKALPLAHIINNKIAVVHGGLPEDRNVTLSEMRKIDRFRECPTSKKKGKIPPASREDRIFQALLWSDPRDIAERTAVSSRGAGVWFNADVTEDFLQTNGLQHLIRSHEVMSQGFRALHDGKCTTVFSASRYCGKDDNRGAYIVVLPTLEMNTSDYFVRAGQVTTLKDMVTKNQEDAKTDSEIQSEVDVGAVRDLAVQRLGELIFTKRSQLLGLFQNNDQDRLGTITKKVWISIMKSTVSADLPWYSLSRHLVEVEHNGTISYIRFLERFQNRLATNWMRSWAEKWMEYGRSHITKCAIDLRKMLRVSEFKKDPKLSYHEVCQALRKSIPGLSMTEIYYLLSHMDANNDGYLDADEWATHMEEQKGNQPIPGILDIWDLRRTNPRKYDALFRDLETSAGGNLVPKNMFVEKAMRACGAKEDSRSGWSLTAETLAKKTSGKVAIATVEEYVNALETDRHRAKVVMDIIEVVTRAQVKLHDIFRIFDVDKSGGLSAEEFTKGLAECGIIESKEEEEQRKRDAMSGKSHNKEVLSSEDAMELWKQCDLDQDSNVTWNEFFEALCIYDTWGGKQMEGSQLRVEAVRMSGFE